MKRCACWILLLFVSSLGIVQSLRAISLRQELAAEKAAAAAAARLWRVESLRGEIKTLQVRERVIDLPEDGHTWHTILFLSPDWRQRQPERKAHTIFYSEPGLASLRLQTHWHLITTDQPEFRKFRPLVSAVPCLLLERANGEVIYRESGPQLGRNNDGLRKAIKREIERHCPDGRCLPLHPVPTPDEPALPDEVPAVLREEPEPEKKPERDSLLGAAIAALLGIGGGMGLALKRE